MECKEVFYLVFFVTLFASSPTSADAAKCSCNDSSLCAPLSTPQAEKEVLGFVVSQHNWPKYNWTHITTLAVYTNLSSDLLCFAHSKNVRVVLGGVYPVTGLSNKTNTSTWIQTQLKRVQESFADGINIDIKDPTRNWTNGSELLTEFVKEVYDAFKSANKAYQVALNIPWSPKSTSGRFYQFDKLPAITDFLVIKAYDEQSRKNNSCVASANSGLNTTGTGILEYFKLGVDPSNLVLGLPWYGYNYLCANLTDDDVCTIGRVSLRGAGCSDAAGSSTQLPYSQVQDLIHNFSATVKLSSPAISPYFNYHVNGQKHQVWFDDPDSLSLKYVLAKKQGLRGLALWNVDSLSYNSNDTRAMVLTSQMWTALDTF